MAKGRIVTDSVRALIARTKEKHEKWTAKEVRKEVEKLLRQQDETLPKGWPGLSVVQRTLADIKRNTEKPSPLDAPWHLGALDEYPIAHAAIPAVLNVWKLRITKAQALADPKARAKAEAAAAKRNEARAWNRAREKADLPERLAAVVGAYGELSAQARERTELGKRLTIREAKWAARLYGVVQDTEELARSAGDYAAAERLYESIGRPFFSGILDAILMGLGVSFSAESAAERLGRPVVHESLLAWEPPEPKMNRKGGK